MPTPPSAEALRALEASCAALQQAGEHGRAAEAYEAAGLSGAAAAIWELLFEHERAHKAFLRAADPVGAMRVALRLGSDAAASQAIAAALELDGGVALERWLHKQGRPRELARLSQDRGEPEAAASHHVAAEAWAEAALCYEAAGLWRDAGRAWERHLQIFPQDAPAMLQLARILLRFRRFEEAIACLQRAQRAARDDAALRAGLMSMMAFAFHRLGFESAANEVLVRWRALVAPSSEEQEPAAHGARVPPDLDAFLASERGRALAAWCAGRPSATVEASSAPGARGDAAFEAAWEGEPVPGGDGLDAVPGRHSAAASALFSTPVEAEASDWLFWGRYLLGPALGSGGSGQVYRAFDAFSDRRVALKVYGAQALKTDAWLRYVRALRAAASLHLPGLVEVVELSEAQGFVVTAWLDCESLEVRLRRGGPADWLVPLVRDLLALLAACHRVGLVHGAIKPANLFIDAAGVRLTDFGAHHLMALRSTETGGLASSWPYLAPEQLLGSAPEVTADLYAVAAVLYRALTGTPPYLRPEDDRQRPPDAPSARYPPLGTAWDAFFARALAPSPAARFPDALAMADAFPAPPPAWRLAPPPALGSHEQADPGSALVDRYRQGRLVLREEGRVAVYEGHDDTLGRPIWWLEVGDEVGWRALAACARISRGVQPVYDLLPDARRVILARDPGQRRANLEELRAHPQSLIRDLAALASALESLHAAGFAWGGFPADRAMGPIGPRFRLAPASLPRTLTEADQRADWRDFERFLAHAFACEPAAETHPKLALLDHLVQLRVWEAEPAAAWGNTQLDVPFSRFLGELSRQLWAGASNRVMVRLAARLLSTKS